VDSELGEIPEGWKISDLGDEFNLTMGQSPPGTTYNEDRKGIPFYQGRADFGFRYPSKRIYCTSPKRFANSGDTLVSVRAPVGDVNMAFERCCIGRGSAAIRHKSGSRSYTYYLMKSIPDIFNNYEAGGTVFGCINKNDFERIDFVNPTPQIISLFENMIFHFDQMVENNSIQIESFAALRDALLPKLLSGEIRVKEAEKIVNINQC
jgi:type I restriction enzyme S subunit